VDTTISVGLAMGILAFGAAGGLALLLWVRRSGDAQRREHRHQQEMKALEVGMPSPQAQLAEAQNESTRIAVAAGIGFFLPLILFVVAWIVTDSLLTRKQFRDDSLTSVVITVWGVAGVMGLGALSFTAFFASLRRPKSAAPNPGERFRAGVPLDDRTASAEVPVAEFQTLRKHP
jgi:hypothetical protein